MAELPTVFHEIDGRPSFVGASAVIEFIVELAAARLKPQGRRGGEE